MKPLYYILIGTGLAIAGTLTYLVQSGRLHFHYASEPIEKIDMDKKSGASQTL